MARAAYLAQYHDPDGASRSFPSLSEETGLTEPRSPADEPVAPPLDPGFFDFDLEKLSREELKRRMYDEVTAFQPLV